MLNEVMITTDDKIKKITYSAYNFVLWSSSILYLSHSNSFFDPVHYLESQQAYTKCFTAYVYVIAELTFMRMKMKH